MKKYDYHKSKLAKNVEKGNYLIISICLMGILLILLKHESYDFIFYIYDVAMLSMTLTLWWLSTKTNLPKSVENDSFLSFVGGEDGDKYYLVVLGFTVLFWPLYWMSVSMLTIQSLFNRK